MQKKAFYIYLSLLCVVVIGITMCYTYIKHEFSLEATDSIVLDSYIINGQPDDFSFRNLTPKSTKDYVVEMNFDKVDVEKITGDLKLIITKMSANSYTVRLNDVLIGSVGDTESHNSSIWNTSNYFMIDRNELREHNVISIHAYAEYKFGKTSLPVIITNTKKSYQIHTIFGLLFADINFVLMGSLLLASLYLIFLMSSTPNFRNSLLLIPIGVSILSIYFLEYTPLYLLPVSLLNFRKIMFLCLYVSTALITYGISYIYNSKRIRILGTLLIVSIAIAILFSKDIIIFKQFYKFINIGLIINVIGWLFLAAKDIKSNLYESLLIMTAGISAILPGVYETVLLIWGIDPVLKISMYGMINCAVGLLFFCYYKYFNHQNNVNIRNILIEKDKIRLSQSLITDELTKLYNQRHLYNFYTSIAEHTNNKLGMILMDFDKFYLVNDHFGHKLGDEILIHFSQFLTGIIKEQEMVFRYSMNTFILVLETVNKDELRAIAEQIRLYVIESKEIQKKSGFIPLTISLGIATIPENAIDLRSLIMCAEKAMRYAKITGGNKTCLYTSNILTLMEQESVSIKKGILTDFVYAFASAIDMKDSYTGQHSEEVCRLSMLIAEKLGINESMKHDLLMGSLLHDIGKLGIPDSIINKNGKLTDDEYSIIKNHSIYGFNMVKQFMNEKTVLSCVRNHHESYDGTGYPDHLAAEEIPLLARIITVADAYHAMVSDRPYRKGLTVEVAIKELEKNKVIQFDPQIVDLFVEYLMETHSKISLQVEFA